MASLASQLMSPRNHYELPKFNGTVAKLPLFAVGERERNAIRGPTKGRI